MENRWERSGKMKDEGERAPNRGQVLEKGRGSSVECPARLASQTGMGQLVVPFFPGRQTTCLFQPFTTSSRAQVLGPASFAQHQGTVRAALLPIVDGVPGRMAGTAGPGGNAVQSLSHPGRRDRCRSAGGWTLDGVRLERVGEKGESVELIVAVGCCMYGDLL